MNAPRPAATGISGVWYRDLTPVWRAGQYFALLYSRKSVENATEKKIELVPQTVRH